MTQVLQWVPGLLGQTCEWLFRWPGPCEAGRADVAPRKQGPQTLQPQKACASERGVEQVQHGCQVLDPMELNAWVLFGEPRGTFRGRGTGEDHPSLQICRKRPHRGGPRVSAAREDFVPLSLGRALLRGPPASSHGHRLLRFTSL